MKTLFSWPPGMSFASGAIFPIFLGDLKNTIDRRLINFFNPILGTPIYERLLPSGKLQ